MKTNRKVPTRVNPTERLAGGAGARAAKQNAEALLRRSVMACLLWEDGAYVDGETVVETIKKLIPQVPAETVAAIAIEARTKQWLRHVPLLLARVMAGLDSHKHVVGKLLPQIIKRPDELAEFLSLYWKDGKCPLSKQVKIGLQNAFGSFDEYQLAKWRGDGNAITLRDVMFLVHPKPTSLNNNEGKNTRKDRAAGKYDQSEGGQLFRRLAENKLETPDTWEVALSSGADPKTEWVRLIREKKLGGLAFLRNIRNMEKVAVSREVIKRGFETVSAGRLLPLNYLAAARENPRWNTEIEEMMFRGLANMPKLHGRSIFVVDVSGSMTKIISSKSALSRLDAAAAMAMLARELCQDVVIYATAGNDSTKVHQTALVPAYRGFALQKEILGYATTLGGGGIFTRQCLEFVKEAERGVTPERIIVFSDSQDCDWPNSRIPKPFGNNNYIIDVSSEKRGINYKGIWAAEISGWSEYFLNFIAGLEGMN